MGKISMSDGNTFGRAQLSPEYEAFLKNNTLPEVNFRFHYYLNIFLLGKYHFKNS
ncbi:hypothetical protein [Chryseobacterium sp. M5A1_1a]